MIVEHTFVSTLEVRELVERAADLLHELGFIHEPGSPGGLEFRRGAKNPQKARRPDNVPQAVRIEYDRGRVTVAASLTPARKPSPEQRELLLIIATTLEAVLAQGCRSQDALQPWLDLRDRISLQVRRRQRVLTIIAVSIVLFFAGLTALLIYLETR